jgi:hypothetical protein
MLLVFPTFMDFCRNSGSTPYLRPIRLVFVSLEDWIGCISFRGRISHPLIRIVTHVTVVARTPFVTKDAILLPSKLSSYRIQSSLFVAVFFANSTTDVRNCRGSAWPSRMQLGIAEDPCTIAAQIRAPLWSMRAQQRWVATFFRTNVKATGRSISLA